MRDAQRSWLVRFVSALAASALLASPGILSPARGADPLASGKSAPNAAPIKAVPADDLAVYTKVAPEGVDDLLKMERPNGFCQKTISRIMKATCSATMKTQSAVPIPCIVPHLPHRQSAERR